MLYTYVTKPNTVETEGIKSPVLINEDLLQHYASRAGSARKREILSYLETVFPGRSRAISCLTEKIPDLNSRKLQGFKNSRECFCFSKDILYDTDIIESVWLFDGDVLKQVKTIDFSPLPWRDIHDDDNVFFKRIRHYMLVLKSGVLSAEHIKKASF